MENKKYFFQRSPSSAIAATASPIAFVTDYAFYVCLSNLTQKASGFTRTRFIADAKEGQQRRSGMLKALTE